MPLLVRPAPYLAHIVLGHARSLFNWAINRGAYGLESSPCDRIKPAALIGAKEPRQRVLNDAELAALWHGSEAIGYPFGPLYQLLLLTGARKSEVAGARWSEFDLTKRFGPYPRSGSSRTPRIWSRYLTRPLPSSGATALHQRRPSIHDDLWREARLRFQQGQGASRQADEETSAHCLRGSSTTSAGQFEPVSRRCVSLTWLPRW